MTVNILLASEFIRQFKRLAKKYRSLASDFQSFKVDLEQTHFKVMTLEMEFVRFEWLSHLKAKGKVAEHELLL